MNIILVLTGLCVLVGSTKAGCAKPSVTTFTKFGTQSKAACPGDLIFEDNFDKLDTTVWPHEVTLECSGHGEFQYYTDDRRISFVKDGILHIKPMLVATDKGEKFLYNGTLDLGKSCTRPNHCKRSAQPGKILNPVASARMRTKGTFSFRYGKLEARLRIPGADWHWPALWMVSSKNVYGPLPRSGEIDIMESKGNVALKYPIRVSSTLHWGPDIKHKMSKLTSYKRWDPSGFQNAFHTYGLEWTPNHIFFSVDNVTSGGIQLEAGGFWKFGKLDKTGMKNPWAGHGLMAPFDEEFYPIINLAVGGLSGYFADVKGKPWSNKMDKYEAMTHFWKGRKQWLKTWHLDTDRSDYLVDYVKIWAV